MPLRPGPIAMVVAGANPMELKRGIEKAVEAIVDELKKMSKPVSGNMIGQVGTIIAQAMEKDGKGGGIMVEEAKSMESSLGLGRRHRPRPSARLGRP